MAGRQAKLLTPDALRGLLSYARTTSTPERDRVIVLLSVKVTPPASGIVTITQTCRFRRVEDSFDEASSFLG